MWSISKEQFTNFHGVSKKSSLAQDILAATVNFMVYWHRPTGQLLWTAQLPHITNVAVTWIKNWKSSNQPYSLARDSFVGPKVKLSNSPLKGYWGQQQNLPKGKLNQMRKLARVCQDISFQLPSDDRGRNFIITITFSN